MNTRTLLVSLAAALLLTACGGGGGDGTESLSIPVDPALEGNVSSSGGAVVTENYIWLGDTSQGVTYRSVSGFPLTDIPADATIVEATLEVYLDVPFQFGAPHQNLGNLLVDLIDLGGSIDASDYTGGLVPAVGVLSDTEGAGVRTVDVTDAVQEALDRGLDSADFRARFQLRTNNDDRADIIMLNGAADVAQSGVTSTLHVTYKTK